MLMTVKPLHITKTLQSTQCRLTHTEAFEVTPMQIKPRTVAIEFKSDSARSVRKGSSFGGVLRL